MRLALSAVIRMTGSSSNGYSNWLFSGQLVNRRAEATATTRYQSQCSPTETTCWAVLLKLVLRGGAARLSQRGKWDSAGLATAVRGCGM